MQITQHGEALVSSRLRLPRGTANPRLYKRVHVQPFSFHLPNMHPISLNLGLALLAVCASAANSPPSPLSDGTQILTPEIDAAINSILADWNTPAGAAVAVVRMDGNGAWQIETKGYGTAKADGTKVSPDTVFSLGSDSKLFDILTTGLLISNESLSPHISWTTKMASIIPDWQLMDPFASSESTITDLMSHRTGLPRHDFTYSVSDDIPSLVKRLRYLKPSTGFRENPQYNNIMYAVLSYLPTVLLPHKPPFAQYAKEHILEPLGMSATTYSFPVANATGNMAEGFARVGINVTENPVGPGTTRVLPYLTPNVTEAGNALSGPGGVLTSAVDAARWLQMLLLNGQHPVTNATIVPAAVIQKVATGISVWEGNPDAPELSPLVYGGAQVQSTYCGHVMIEHGGDTLGFHSQITRFPDDNLGIAVLTNDDTFGYRLKEVIKFRIVDAAFGLEPVDWSFRFQAIIAASAIAPPTTPAPPNATLPVPITALAKIYSSPGYGADIELCAVLASVGHSASRTCGSLIQQLNSTFPDQLVGADLVWAWGKLSASYIALRHFDAGVFNLTGWIALPTVNDASTPFWAYDAGLEGLDAGLTAEFDLHKGKAVGFGIRGGIWGAGTVEDEPMGKTIRERSEVWYVAV
ncbi:Beta-lactamase domain-containing protein [Mycena venus]|uniref:Beta-lactamase domain-containing protein n=1 Tax=Mycena venus TaxID=2733690 RepID=A0A8H6XXP0_9AGAR|nr:Beta-lactamase domain-containing protein [Mycena venus]